MSPGTRTRKLAAVDLGATSGRVMLAEVGPDLLRIREVTRFANGPLPIWNGNRTALHWDVPGLFAHIREGLAAAGRDAGDLAAIGVDSWAVDYGLLRDGRLLGLPYHYRDDRNNDGVSAVHSAIDPADLYARNGLQFLPFNTVYQLMAEKQAGTLDLADQALLVPDLIGYWLTGEMATERTNASTTGLLGADGRWDDELQRILGLPTGLFPGLIEPGSQLGTLLPDLASGLGLSSSVSVNAVASHDTASAVVAVPMRPGSSAYISCGTWGLVGVELTSRVTDPAARVANFTNEVGADGRIRFLRNVMGLWLLSESVRQWERAGATIDLAELLEQAAAATPPAELFDTDDPEFLSPGDMPGRIAHWYAARGLPAPGGPAQMVRAILESLAGAFARRVHEAASLSGTAVETVHLVGGGARNRLLCQLTADRLGMPVLAGPVEATAIGNVLVTARAQNLIADDLESARAMVAATFPPERYEPRTTASDRTDFVGVSR
ncbi:rhamnulokinase family protein [Nocardia sp. 348MFTsu5.1]|uniref:rhamnulokinase n=1 Tax=Nocardia sp. 348MFTsu5.1 TaxID=1172185 RepID=UPI000374938D|nr:rhamnulokinase family protein [Nocardia sp. 348MFTsu5.1]